MKVKEESEKADMKLNIQKTKVMASAPIPSWQIDGQTGESVTDFIFLGCKITAEASTLWPPDGRTASLEKTLMLGKIEGGRRRGRQRVRWLDGITDSMDMGLSKFCEEGQWRKEVEDRGAWRAAVHGVTKSRTQLIGWTTTATSQKNLSWRKKSKEVRTEKQVSIKWP